MNVSNQLMDAETARMQRNMTQSQKRNALSTKEGTIVNSLVYQNFKESPVNMNDICDSLIISDNTKNPKELNLNIKNDTSGILPIAGITTGVMTAITGLSYFIKNNTKNITGIAKEKKLADIPRNIQVNEETQQAIFRIVQCPTRKTVIAGVGVLALTAMTFMGKTFIDGFKEVWVKKKEADINKNLQENLINVEARAFSGKISITRNMLSEKAKEFRQIIDPEACCGRRVKFDGIKFTGKNNNENSNNDNLKYFSLGIGTIASIIGLGFVAIKNLGKSKGFLDKYIQKTENEIEKIATNSIESTKNKDIEQIKERFQVIDATEDYMQNVLNKTNWTNKEKDEIIFDIKKSSVQTNKAIGGDGNGKPSFMSFVDDYRAFFYNWLLDPSNKQFRNLFIGIAGVSTATYTGKVAGDAIKEVQVKKINADTELKLQNNLVSTELRNFKAKKDAAINPLVSELYSQRNKNKPKTELKTMADNILYEIKNGAPFVYS